MFWRKKPLTIRFVTANRDAFAFCKPDKATKFFPDWWKDLAKNHKNHTYQDMTYCNGFTDLYKKSIIVPSWSHFIMTVGYDFYEWKFMDDVSTANEHLPVQRGSLFPENDYQHLKLWCPWYMECDEDIFVSWQEPTYSHNIHGVQILSGLTQPKYMSTVNINIMFKREKETKQYEWDLGYPLVQMLPLTEREFKIEHLLLSEEEIENRKPVRYHSKFAQHNKGLRELSKCPFGGSK